MRARRVDYPKPIVDHDAASKENMSKMKAAYDAHKAKNGDDQDGDDGARRRAFVVERLSQHQRICVLCVAFGGIYGT